MFNLTTLLISLLLCLSLRPTRGFSLLSWEEYLSKFPHLEINALSRHHFEENIKYIIEHNSMGHSYTLGVTPFLHLSETEWRSRFHNISLDFAASEIYMPPSLRSSPSSWSWVSQGVTTPVKDQGQCGSCWAFSTTESIETTWAIKTGQLKVTAPQQLVDCSKLNQGCNGGLQSRAYKYLESTAQCLEKDYPYTAKDGTCHSCTGAVGKVSSYVTVKDEAAMASAILVTSLAVAIQADQKEFQMYTSGVLDFKCGTDLNHAVNVEGYGTENGKDYWLVRNSWGEDWGDKGYIKMARGKNLCGISDSVVYAKM